MWKSFQHKISTAQGLTFSDWLLLAQAWGVYSVFSLRVRRSSLEHLKNSFRLKDGKKADPSGGLAFAHRLQKLVSLAARYHSFSSTCLVRACALHWMLGRRGIPSRLCIGVNRSPAGIHAHAWVEVSGEAVGEPEDIEERFNELT